MNIKNNREIVDTCDDFLNKSLKDNYMCATHTGTPLQGYTPKYRRPGDDCLHLTFVSDTYLLFLSFDFFSFNSESTSFSKSGVRLLSFWPSFGCC